jgi:hypothetical protein
VNNLIFSHQSTPSGHFNCSWSSVDNNLIFLSRQSPKLRGKLSSQTAIPPPQCFVPPPRDHC